MITDFRMTKGNSPTIGSTNQLAATHWHEISTIVPHHIIGYGMEARFASHMPRYITEGTEGASRRKLFPDEGFKTGDFGKISLHFFYLLSRKRRRITVRFFLLDCSVRFSKKQDRELEKEKVIRKIPFPKSFFLFFLDS
ncbi:hypothetical protein TNCV_262411 [Trichonephila clavipes]|nr:hypothetical protein TNCV_262411 [Trichonephila clavipes]